MSKYSFKLPDLGEGIVESEINNWHVKVGDVIKEDQHIADVMTDKAVVEVTSPVSGTVLSLACGVGEVLAVGSELILFDVLESSEPADLSDSDEGDKPAIHNEVIEDFNSCVEPVESSTYINSEEKIGQSTEILASPSVRRRARENQVRLTDISGTGPSSRVSNSDLDSFLSTKGDLSTRTVGIKKTTTTKIKIRGLRRKIAQKMSHSVTTIPHYSYIEEVDVTALEELRLHLNQFREATQTKLTILPFLMQALTRVIPQHPCCNAHYEDNSQTLTQFDAAHIGIATMTTSGLMVPVVRHVEALDLWNTARQLTTLTESAKTGKALTSNLTGSTITITSLGAIGGLATTPIINAPETTIIGINKIQDKVVVKNKEIVIRKVMNISSSFDHRIIDGYDGAQFIQALKKYIENPATIFI